MNTCTSCLPENKGCLLESQLFGVYSLYFRIQNEDEYSGKSGKFQIWASERF